MAHVTDSTTLGFTCHVGWDETEFKEGNFVQVEARPEYVAQITEMETASDYIEATVSLLGSYPDRPFRPGEDNEITLASPNAVRDALRLPDAGMHIGEIRDIDASVYLNPNDVLSTQIGVFGKTGSGKSYTGAVLLEELLRLQKMEAETGVGVVIIDPHGEFGSLRLTPDGEPSEFGVVEYGHAEYTEAEHDLSDAVDAPRELINPTQATVLNLSGIDSDRQHDVVSEVAETLFQARMRKEIPPTKLVIEEAHLFAPTGGGSTTRDVIENIAKEGRKFSFTLNCVTQRPAELYANVRAQMQSVFVHKLTDNTDIRKITKSTEGIDKSWGTPIQKLDTGECLLAGSLTESPAFVDVRTRLTMHYESGGENGDSFHVEQYATSPEAVDERQDELEAVAESHPVSELQSKVEALESEKQALENRVEMLNNQLEQKEQQIASLKEDSGDSERVQALEETCEQQRDKIDELEDELERVREEREQLRSDIESEGSTKEDEAEVHDSSGLFDSVDAVLDHEFVQTVITRYQSQLRELDDVDAKMVRYFKHKGWKRPGRAYFHAGRSQNSNRANRRCNSLVDDGILKSDRRSALEDRGELEPDSDVGGNAKYFAYGLADEVRKDLPEELSEDEFQVVMDEIESVL